jgi:dipeptidyl aminopeptidase/acylaminoacyl peptidase
MNPLAGGGNVFLQKLEQLQVSGEPTPLTNGRSVRTLDWMQDSRSIIHDSVYVEPGLWRIAVAGGAPELVLPNIRAGRPSAARRGDGLVYQNSLIAGNIWELPTPSSPNRQPSGDATFPVIESTSRDFDMRFSPDGTRIAFVSMRSGKSELWVSNRDGSQQTQLTNFDGWRPGSPGWSTDGKRIAFDGTQTGTGNWNLYIVSADRGPVKPLTSDAFNNIRPSWSRDDQWIYFGSDHKGDGDWQIWKIPSIGGTPIPVTRGGGYEPIVSPDGRHIFYAKPPPTEGIWRVPAEGGQEVEIVKRGRNLNFDVAENGIFMMDPSAKPQATVEMFSFSSRQIVPVARLPPGVRVHGSSYLTVTRDGRSMLYSRFDLWMSDIEMLPGFR